MSFSNNEIILLNRRSGKSDDPFVSVSESIKVIGNKCLLAEIPNFTDKVTIQGSGVTWIETTSLSPTADQYVCDYSRGIVTFNSSREGLTLTFSYKGKGFSSMHTDKIHTSYSGSTVTQTLTAKISAMDTKDTSLQTQITDNDQARITALTNHQNSVTSHAAQNITYSGTVPSQTTTKGAIDATYSRIDNIIAGAPSSAAEVIDGRTLSDNVARSSLGVAIREIHAKQLAAVNSPVTIKRGLNSVNAPEGGKLDVKVKGVTRVNLLGKDGNCEDTSKFSVASSSIVLDSSNAKYGTNAFKMTGNVAGSSFVYQNAFSKINTSKYYLLIASVKKLDAVDFAAFVDNGLSDNKYGNLISSTTYGDTYLKISPTYLSSATQLLVGARLTSTAIGQYGYVDGIRLYEIDSATYNKIDVDAEYTGDKLADKFPYVDGMKPLTTPYIEKKGKNLLPPFTEWTLHANAVATEPYKLTLTATATYDGSDYELPAISGQTYTLSATISGYVSASVYPYITWAWLDSTGAVISWNDANPTANGALTTTATAPSNAVKIKVRMINIGVGTFTFTNPILVLGASYDGVFEPKNNDYAYAISDSTGRPLAVCSNIDNSVADEINFSTGIKFKRFEYMDLDGTSGWLFEGDASGHKYVKIPKLTTMSATLNKPNDYQTCIKYDGKILKNDLGGTGGTMVANPDYLYIDANYLYISITDTDTGWTEAMAPSSDEIKAYMFGYKLCDVAGAAYVSGTKYWKKITDGTGITSTLPTASYTGYTPYKLQYQLATAIEEVVTVEGSINLHSGLNQVESGEGFVIREKITPFLSGSTYYINAQNSSAYFKNKAAKLINVYKDTAIDKGWTLKTDGTANGTGYATLPSGSYASGSTYTATYALTDKYASTSNVVDITASVPSSQKAVLETNVQQIADTATQVSINTKSIIDILVRLKSAGIA